MKMEPINASKKLNQKISFSNLHHKRQRHKPQFRLGQLVGTTDIKKVFFRKEVVQIRLKIYIQ